jgi:amidophosphoribosyltransferase
MPCGIGLDAFDRNALKNSYNIALSQQNRGQETYGISYLTGNVITTQKVLGPISNFLNLIAGIKTDTNTAIVHGRYSTTSISNLKNAGPIHVKDSTHKREVSLAHNGTIANYEIIRKPFLHKLETDVDTEAIAHIFNESEDYFQAFEKCREEIVGSYNLTGLNNKGEALVLKDPKGFQPLYVTKLENNEKVMAASQDLSLRTAGYSNEVREVKPGEIIKIDREGNVEREEHPSKKLAECPFEKAYFLREGCVKDGEVVNDFRHRLGYLMGKNEDKKDGIAVPILRSGTDYALGFSEASDLPYVEALALTGTERLYMMTEKRIINSFFSKVEKLRQKHTPVIEKVKGKKVNPIDDSIVRGDTAKIITGIFYDAGASRVEWNIPGFPPVTNPCIYGKDHNVKKDLIAAKCATKLFGKDFDFDTILKHQDKLEKAVAEEIGADSVKYPNFEDWSKAFNGLCNHCQACFSGVYPTSIPEEQKDNFRI